MSVARENVEGVTNVLSSRMVEALWEEEARQKVKALRTEAILKVCAEVATAYVQEVV